MVAAHVTYVKVRSPCLIQVLLFVQMHVQWHVTHAHKDQGMFILLKKTHGTNS
jgi:hypothetical protein